MISLLPTSSPGHVTTKAEEPHPKRPSEPVAAVAPVVATGNEREELLKGMEVLEKTRQWFNDRLGQLALENSSHRKVHIIIC